MTIGAGGIDASAAFQSFYGQSKVTLGASQTWNVANANTAGNPTGFNNGEDISFQAQAAGTAFNLGGHTLTTTGPGQINLTSGYTLSNGTINSGNDFFTIQGGTSRVTTIMNTVNLIVTSGTLRVQGNSGAGGVSMVSNAPVTVNGGIFSIRNNTAGLSTTQSGNITLNSGSGLSYQVDTAGASTTSGNIAANGATTWRVAGAGTPTNGASITGNLSGSGNITYLNTATGATGGFVRLSGDNSGYSGAFTLSGASGNRILRLASATAGSAAATWNVETANILQVDGVSVQLGALNGGGTVTNSSTAAPAAITVGAGVFSGAINDGASQPTTLTKTGPGTLVLTGLNTYTGATTVSGGILVTTPDQTGTGAVSIADGAAFGTQVKTAETSLSTGNMTVGTSTGGTLQFDYGNHPNPTVAALAVNDLLLAGTSTVQIAGKSLTAGTFPVLQYTTLNGASAPVSSLNLKLPTRTNGSLSEPTPGIVSVTITDTQQVKWDGDLSNDWDIDPDGSGSTGTANWRTTVTNDDTRYIQGANGTDVVTFDDSATGGGTVNLTTTLSPLGLTVNNSTAKDYTFTGSGKLSGFTGLEKLGDGMLTLANTAANDYSGGTVITAGTLRLGDGTTPGAGAISGPIENSGTLVINRPDDHDFLNALTGAGVLEKAQASTMTFPAPTTLNHPLVISGGKVRFANGGFVNDAISGVGGLETNATLDLAGSTPNTHTGLTTVTAGALRLSKSAEGIDAVGGDIDITGTGTLAILANEQVPDTATIRALGSSNDSLAGSTGVETFANAVVNGTSTATQMILRNTPVITGSATIQQGVLSIASSHSATINAVNLTAATGILRLAGNTGPTTLNVGTGGITASAGTIEVKLGNSDQDAVLNLSGNVTATGNLSFTNGNYTGANLNVVRLNGSRTFDITTGITVMNPDLGDFIDSELNTVPGTLVKTGAGALVMDASCRATHSGGTTVSAGALRVHGEHTGAIQVDADGSLGGLGEVANATVEGTLTPGGAGAPAVGHLESTGTVTFAPGSDQLVEIGNWLGTNETVGTDWDYLTVNSLAYTATAENKHVIRVTGPTAGFTETNKTLAIASSTAAVAGFDPAVIEIDATGFSGTGTWAVQLTGTVVELVYSAAAGSPYEDWAADQGLDETNDGIGDDPDQDGQNNLVEFALNSTALSGASSGKRVGKIATAGGESALTITFPVRDGASFSGTTEQVSAAVDGVIYRIQAGNNLGTWDLAVSEVTGADATAIQTGLPVLDAGWTYRTFRSPSPVSGDAKEFIRVVIDPAS